MTGKEWESDTLSLQLQAWWDKADPLVRPSLKEQIQDTMKQGLLVDIEVHLATARYFLPKSLFELQADRYIQAGLLNYEERSSLSLALTGQVVFKELESYRKKAHKNCAFFSFKTDAGYFVPHTAIDDWKKAHYAIADDFKTELERFKNEDEINTIQENLKSEFRTRIQEIWRSIKKAEIPLCYRLK